MRAILFPLVILLVAGALFWMMKPEPESDVVLYCSVDQDQSRPFAMQFEEETGLAVGYVPEIESQRSIGLPQLLRREKDRPRADVYWSNEIMNMVDLGRRGILAPLPPVWPMPSRRRGGIPRAFTWRSAPEPGSSS